VSGARRPAADRDQRLAEAHDLLVSAVGKLASTQDWLRVLDVSRRLPNYSANNCLLLMVQGAEGLVMGYQAWRRIPARDGGTCQVRRGAKGLAILAPVTRTVDGGGTGEPDEAPQRGAEADGPQSRVRRLVGFRVAHVFDQRALVSPPDLPDVRPRLLDGQPPARLCEAVAAEVTAAGYRLYEDPRIAPANGQTDFVARTVAVRPDLPPAQRVKTLAHELAHVVLHAPDRLPAGMTRSVAEVEAESVAYLVMGELGLDSADYTLPYVADWAAGNTELILSTANRAVTAARQVLDQLTRTLDLPVPPADATGLPPAPTPRIGDGRALSILDDAPPAVDRVRIGTPSGRWELGWDPPLGTFYAQHHAMDGDDLDEPQIWLGTYPRAVPTVGELEQRLGFPLPAAARTHLAADQHTRPARTSRAFPFLHTGDDEPADWSKQTQPTPDSPVEVPGRPDTTYRRALRADPPLRAWEQDGHRVEILAATPFTDPDTRTTRQAIDYRLTHHGRVIFSGDDIESPQHVDPSSDEAVRAVADLLTQPTDPPANPLQRTYLDTHAEILNAYLQPPDPPHPQGTRVLRVERDQHTTGTITEAVTDPDGALLAYAWRPDHADLPGHPWQQQPWQAILVPPSQLTPTVAGPDVGLTGWTPAVPLAHGATVALTDQAGARQTGRVLRAFADPAGLSYQVQPDDPTTPPVIASAADLDPVAGTAWTSIRHLVAARAHPGVPLQPGELLAAGAHRAWVVAGPTGPTLTDTPPAAPAPAAPAPAAPAPAVPEPAAPAPSLDLGCGP